MVQNVSTAVMQRRTEALDGLDDFPTPPWATRALVELLANTFNWGGHGSSPWPTIVREPCANRGFMARPLKEYFHIVDASDVYDYGAGYPVEDYLLPGALRTAQWTFLNPPFNLAADFILKSFQTPGWEGTAAFVRTAFLEGQTRHARLFSKHPPMAIAQFTERVILHKGAVRDPALNYWDASRGEWRKPSTATSYCWVVWAKGLPSQSFRWIPPCRKRLERPGDYMKPDGGPKCTSESLLLG